MKTNIDFSLIDNLAKSLDEPLEGERIVEIPVDKVIPDAEQPRKTRDRKADKELANNIAQIGVQQPIIVQPADADGQHQILVGERRWHCSKLAGKDTVPSIVRALDPELIFLVQVVENLNRDALTFKDELAAVARLAKTHGATQAAKRLGRAPQWVSKRARIYSAPQIVQQVIEADYSRDVTALYAFANLARSDEDKARNIVRRVDKEPSGFRDLVVAATAPATVAKQAVAKESDKTTTSAISPERGSRADKAAPAPSAAKGPSTTAQLPDALAVSAIASERAGDGVLLRVSTEDTSYRLVFSKALWTELKNEVKRVRV